MQRYIDKHGRNRKDWPDPCCGARFLPWKRGASKVVEVCTGLSSDGKPKWECLLADRLPENLDDEIKKHLHEWHQASQKITPEEILEAIPLTIPKLNEIEDNPGIARFDINLWKKLGQPTLTASGWMALCKIIAKKDPVNLQAIITLCDQGMSAPEPEEDGVWC